MNGDPRSTYRARLSQEQRDTLRLYIGRNIARGIPVAELARVAGVSTSHFAVLFRRAMGMSAHQYVVQCRVARAIEVLSRNNARICDAAHEAGFTDQSHLARWMRRLTGMTPTVLVRKLQ